MRVSMMTAAFAASALVIGVPVTAFAASVPDFAQNGFPHVVAMANIAPDANAPTTITVGDATITIPVGFSSDPVTFEVLQGPLPHFDQGAPIGDTPIYDFAFRVEDQATGALVGKFQAPVTFSYTSRYVTSHSLYFNVSTTGTYTDNPKTLSISGDTLSHKIAGAGVGWVLTTPTNSVANLLGLRSGVAQSLSVKDNQQNAYGNEVSALLQAKM